MSYLTVVLVASLCAACVGKKVENGATRGGMTLDNLIQSGKVLVQGEMSEMPKGKITGDVGNNPNTMDVDTTDKDTPMTEPIEDLSEIFGEDNQAVEIGKDDEVDTFSAAATEPGASARAFMGLRPNYCYDSAGSGFFSRSKCSTKKRIKKSKCPRYSCAFRPLVAVYKNQFWFRVAQTNFIQQSVGVKLCRNPGQMCACRKNCSDCKRRKSCQNTYGMERHRLVLVVPIKNAAPRLVRVWAKVKVSVDCKCVK